MGIKVRRLLAGAVLASVAGLGLGVPAMAESPVTIPPGDFIVDDANVLGSDIDDLEKQITQLRNDTGISFFAVYVDEFTDPNDPREWAKEVYTKKNMGTSDVLLVVATEQRQAYLGSSENSPINDYRQDIFSKKVLPALSDDDWAGAAEGAIDGIESAANNDPITSGSSSGISFFWVMIIVAGVGVLGFLILNRRSKNRNARLPQGQAQGPIGYGQPQTQLVPLEQLRRQADQLLVAADDSIRSSEQELGFAEAQYGKSAIEVFAKDLSNAKEQLTKSFHLQQQLDDDIPDTEQDQRNWLGEIISRCGQVNEILQKHADAFKSLRQLEQNAETRITELTAEQEPLNQKLSAQVSVLEQLTAKYDQTAVSQIMDNVEQASERLSFSASALKQATDELTKDRSAAAALIQNAEESQDQAGVLMEAITKSAEALRHADTDLESAVALAARDVAQAKALVDNGSQPDLAGAVSTVMSTLNSIKQSIQGGKHNPLALIAQLDEASMPLSSALATLRNQAEQQEAARAQLQSLLRTAESRVEGTEDYIRARRGGVRSSARTRLSEAQRCLDDAHSMEQRDPATAVAAAQRAIQLADQAASMAEQDVNGFGGGDGFGSDGGFGGRGRGRGGMFDGIGGAVLGGILIDSILNGGHRGGHGGDDSMFGGGGFGGFGGGDGGFGGGDGGGFGGAGGSF
ncbi:TPM domain-containing protein [Glutamicibacter sp.]|uniref:TPM domain-containing protein n=1 Tax=Glutamicibacter sp. TaxID=1931995 RepID=UPI0028BD9A55|nr:TPM domain-containing protein [Glutamicibacter sp.]